VGAFPRPDLVEILSEPNCEKFDLVLSRNVFNLITYDEIMVAFDKVFDLMKPGGKFFFTALTPYMNFYKKEFRNQFDQQVQKFIESLKHPNSGKRI